MTNTAHIPQEDLALFAMQTLSEKESAVVRAHLNECAACRGELATISGDLALVALSAERKPVPEGARQRLLDRIAADATPETNRIRPAVAITDARPPRRVYSFIPWSAVAALILVALGLLLKIGSLQQELLRKNEQLAQTAAANSHAQEVLDVLTAPAAQHVLLVAGNTRPAPTGRAVYLANRGGLIFQASNLDALPPAKTYELWVIPANGQAPIAAGLFRPDATGSASVVLPPLPTGVAAKAFGVTIEKAEGSTTPTAPIVLAGAATSPGL